MDEDNILFLLIGLPGVVSVGMTSLKSAGAPIPISLLWCALSPFIVAWGLFIAIVIIIAIILLINQLITYNKHF